MDLVQSFRYPRQHVPGRVGGGRRTSVVSLEHVVTLDFHASSTDADPGNPQGQTTIYLFRDPLCCLRWWDPNPTNKVFAYDLSFANSAPLVGSVNSNNSPPGPAYTITLVDSENDASVNHLPIAWATVDSTVSAAGFRPYDGFEYAVIIGKQRAIWIDADQSNTTTINITLGSTSASATADGGTLAVFYSPTGEAMTRLGGATIGWVASPGTVSVSYVIRNRGYYAFGIEYFSSSNTNNTFHVNISQLRFVGNCGVFQSRALPGLSTVVDSLSDIKVNAAALTVECTAAVVSMAGTLAMAQASSATPWTAFAGANALDDIATTNVNDYLTMNFARGGYAFLKPSDVQDLQFSHLLRSSLGSAPELIDVVVPWPNRFDYLPNVIVVPADLSGAYGGALTRFTASYHVEFVPITQWFLEAPPTATQVHLLGALDLLAQGQVPQFCEGMQPNIIVASGKKVLAGDVEDEGKSVKSKKKRPKKKKAAKKSLAARKA